ncbi:hypothetical protein GCM10023143_18030 [Compostibacter hankyongensis]|uniref:Lysozyme inhibitor LprI-like N-terminal domain-containing protein n=2 Tax=Compostibacter hankyongensis TaxID=1007089 RepID=A0ABP8FS70_9BACT
MSTQDSILYEKRKAFFVAAFKEQREMNIKAYQTYQKKKAKMDSTYRSVLSEYSKDTLFVRKMKVSQLTWEKSLEADMDAIFPQVKTNPMYYGDIQPLCDYDLRSAFVDRRTAFLAQWLRGFPEGECCSGSVKMNHGEYFDAIPKEELKNYSWGLSGDY